MAKLEKHKTKKPGNMKPASNNTNIFQKSKKVLTERKGTFAKKELAEAINIVDKSMLKVGVILLSVEVSKSYEEMNCQSMREWMIENLPNNYEALNRHLVAARIAYNVEGFDAIGKYSNNSLEPLNKLNSIQQKKVFAKVKKDLGATFSSHTLTKEVVVKAIADLGYAPPPKNKEEKTQDLEPLIKTVNELGKQIDNPRDLSLLLLNAFNHEVLEKAMKLVNKKLRQSLANA